jgi:hypothetical protein
MTLLPVRLVLLLLRRQVTVAALGHMRGTHEAKGKAKENPEPLRAKELPRKKLTGFFSDSDEEEGPVIKRRKIMGLFRKG